MENHFFSDPVPISSVEDYDKVGNDSSNKNIPTWKVIVYRRQGSTVEEDESELYGNNNHHNSGSSAESSLIGGAIEVDVLYINDNSFPPRKSATTRQNSSSSSSSSSKKGSSSGKILWKLPDNYETIPKFGFIEQNRLWELYKQQKKERRKQKLNNNTTTINSSTNTSTSAIIEDTSNNQSIVSTAVAVDIDGNNEQVTTASTSIHKSTIESKDLPNSPPPGFAQLVPTSTPKPPPGFLHSQRSPTSPLVHQQLQQQQQQNLKPLQKYFIVEIPQQQLQEGEQHESTSQTQLCDILGNIVAYTFAESVTKNCVENGWLPYYYDSGSSSSDKSSSSSISDETQQQERQQQQQSALSALLIGTGKVSCTTFDERCQQWTSLSQIGSIWEIHGFIAQPQIVIHTNTKINTNTNLLNGSNNRSQSTNGSKTIVNNGCKKKKNNASSGTHLIDSNVTTGSSSSSSSSSRTTQPIDINNDNTNLTTTKIDNVLIVLTGKVLQPQTGWFGYSLSLCLSTAVIPDSTNSSNSSIDGKEYKNRIIHKFVILNEVLTLFAMS